MTIKTKLFPFGYKKKIYFKEQIIFESATAGTYELEIFEKRVFRIILSGAGGGGAYQYSSKWADRSRAGGGGSGAAFYCDVKLKKGKYAIVVGTGGINRGNASSGGQQGDAGGASKITNNDFSIICNGGDGGYGAYLGSGIGGAGGILEVINANVVETFLQSNGTAGTGGGWNATYPGSDSPLYGLLDINYGKGGIASCLSSAPGTDGYCKIVCKK